MKTFIETLPEGFHYVDTEDIVVMDDGSIAVSDTENAYGHDGHKEMDNQDLLSQESMITTPVSKVMPTRHDDKNDSRNRIEGLKHLVGHDVPDNFDPHEISWVLPNLGVTGSEGADQAIKQGHFVINVADELFTNAAVKMPIEPNDKIWGFKSENTVLPTLEKIVNTMKMAMDTGQKVVVNCSMGMERSVLATVWFLIRHKSMSLDTAYGFVRSVRPIATDRREWLTM